MNERVKLIHHHDFYNFNKKKEILRKFEFENDSFVTNVKFFTIKANNNWSKMGALFVYFLCFRNIYYF